MCEGYSLSVFSKKPGRVTHFIEALGNGDALNNEEKYTDSEGVGHPVSHSVTQCDRS